ncbi:LuxR C-terminal-related transcriptional regulator, partial [Hydrogenibacillus schlegelii]|uniref:LuxR C-terminal-related transcriptional regulator n=1 Tax=Hydrogenibacillus schlegelii TaxID=1484 RepID=UPI0034A03B85
MDRRCTVWGGAAWLCGLILFDVSISVRIRDLADRRGSGTLAAGASTGEIARKLHLSRSTIKTHLARIAEKLGIEPGV